MDSESRISEDRAAPGAGLPAPEADCPVLEWTQNFGRYAESIPLLVGEVGRRFRDCGLPLARLSVLIRTLHPQILAAGFVWDGETGETREFTRDHQSQSGDAYLRSPVRRILEGSPGIRRRLLDPDCPRDFPILEDLAADGFTDYVILPVPFSDGQSYACSWATRAPGGFPDGALRRIAQLMPTFSLVLEILAVRRVARNLMDTYLGRGTGRRVLEGRISRGGNEDIEAVIWISDLRRFTRMSDEFAPAVMLGILNDHFERVVGAIGSHGGEVLKFMGDSVLAIFPVAAGADPRPAVDDALGAAREAAARIGEGNAARRAKDLPEIGFGIALHHGDVVYGNIGAADRLDFTVIGAAVNQAARIAALCRTLDRPVLASRQIADAAGHELVSLGFHALRGVREPQEILTLPEYA